MTDPRSEIEQRFVCLDAFVTGGDWSCIEYDGTGLWCDNCLAMAGLLVTLNPLLEGAQIGRDEPDDA